MAPTTVWAWRLRSIPRSVCVSRFGWPFVLAVRGPTGRGLTRAEIIAALRHRLVATPEVEMDECLRQIDRIAEIRLHERMGLGLEAG